MSAIRNGTWLDEQVFPETAWAVPGIIPEGRCILAGHPKIGKSFLILAIALAAANADQVLGVQVEQRPVLYLALEDNARRLQHRARKLLDDRPLPSEFYYVTSEHHQTAMNLAAEWVQAHSARKPMVVVDTLERVRPARGVNAYQDDYRAGASLEPLVATGGVVVAVHHTRKGTSDDFLNDVSGTLGLAGAFDTVITLKRERTGRAGTLSVTGRDVEEMVYALTFDNGTWNADGPDLAAAARNATQVKLSDTMQNVLELVSSRIETTAADVVATLGIGEATARQYLRRLATEHRLIARIRTGVYGPVTVSHVSREEDCAGPGGEAA
jgi:RecA-family ATPase